MGEMTVKSKKIEQPNSDFFKTYLKHIGKKGLLSREEEVDIYERIEDSYRSLVNTICDYEKENDSKGLYGISILLDELANLDIENKEKKVQRRKAKDLPIDNPYRIISDLEDVIVRGSKRKRSNEKEKAKDWLFELLHWSEYSEQNNEDEIKETFRVEETVETYRQVIISTVERIIDETKNTVADYNKFIFKAETEEEMLQYQEKKSQIEEMVKNSKKIIREIQKNKHGMAERNLGLVINIAKRYQGRGLALDDLISEGNIGLMKAVEKFDYRKRNKFSSYATWWIRQSIMYDIKNNSRDIRLPVSVIANLMLHKKASKVIEEKVGREPTENEISNYVADHFLSGKRENETAEKFEMKIQEAKGATGAMVRLDKKVNEDAEVIDFIENPNDNYDPTKQYSKKELELVTRKVLSTLTPREEKIIRMRFGIGEEEAYTLEKTSKSFNVSRERIRQIEVIALRRLRHATRRRRLEPFLEE